jgi:LPS-assembly protein
VRSDLECWRVRRQQSRWIGLALSVALLLASVQAVQAQRAKPDPNDPEPPPFQRRSAPDKHEPIVLTADEVTYDAQTEVVVATGRVEVTQKDPVAGGERTLRADRLIYDRKQDVVRAIGNVVLIEPTGEVGYAPTMDITGDFKEAVAEDLRVRLANDALLAAGGGRRTGGNVSELAKVTYSACKLCEKDPMRPPLWQVKSRKVVHDQQEKRLYFYDSTFEMFGLPIAWLPFFQHPDPTVKRASGFLAPVFEYDKDTGFGLTVPYYWVIDDQRDATIYARYTERRGPVLAGEYRQVWDHARLKLFGSLTEDIYQGGGGNTDDVRGHLFANFRQDINDTWRAGFDIERASDRYYLRQYDYGKPNYLTSRAYAEAFWRRSYFAAEAYNFQQMRPQVSGKDTPYFVPRVRLNYVGDPLPWGGHFIAEANTRTVLRERGSESTRLTALTGYSLPSVITDSGHVFDFLATVRGDLFNVDDAVDPIDSTNQFTGVRARFFPQVAATWRYPLARKGEGTSYQVVEPIVGFVVGPNLGRQWRYDNQDSLEQVFDDTNLFFPNRNSGNDILDSGQRINYGLKVAHYDALTNGIVAFVGQSWRTRENRYFTEQSGLRSKLSDVVASLMVNPGGWWDVMARARLDKDKPGRLNQVDVFGSAGPKWLRPWVHYISLSDDLQQNVSFGERKEVRIGVMSQPTDNWRLIAWGSRDMVLDKFSTAAIDVQYEDECFLAGVRLARNLPLTADSKSDDRILVRFVIKQFTDTKF